MHLLTLELPPEFAAKLAALHPDGLDAAVHEGLTTYASLGVPTITKLRDNAQKANTPIADVIRDAIIDRSVTKAERDANIIAEVLDGKRRALVAAKYRLSLIRIHQIMAKYHGQQEAAILAQDDPDPEQP
jgi:hypothetical protein